MANIQYGDINVVVREWRTHRHKSMGKYCKIPGQMSIWPKRKDQPRLYNLVLLRTVMHLDPFMQLRWPTPRMVFSVVWTKCNLTHVWSTFCYPLYKWYMGCRMRMRSSSHFLHISVVIIISIIFTISPVYSMDSICMIWQSRIPFNMISYNLWFHKHTIDEIWRWIWLVCVLA